MLYSIDNGKVYEADIKNVTITDQHKYFGFISYDKSETVLQKFGFNGRLLKDLAGNNAMAFENHEGFDFICVNVLNRKTLAAQTERVYIYVRKEVILFISKNVTLLEKMMRKVIDNESLNTGFNRILSTFFEKLTANDVNVLEKIEQEISNLENALIASKKRDCVKEIISLRKRLMAFKRYYEQLLDVLDELQENENSILNENSLRYFKIYTNRVDRLYHNILNLRDYVTQVREAYQAEVDIGLNNIMKIFTVITAIFLPLTLLVGWYGMNLQMPEFKWPLGYPLVIVLSVAIVVFCLTYFKKHKWF
ncbi:MAG: CorA family divalent cation transporter [Eubacteriales bacterium]